MPVYTLANAAREIVGSILNQTGVVTAAGEMAGFWGIKEKDLVRPLVLQANFFKHADRDADAKLVFDEDHVRHMFIFAINDFRRSRERLPVETRVYRIWKLPSFQKLPNGRSVPNNTLRNCIKLFPGIRRAVDLAAQKKIGLACLYQALANPTFQEKLVSISRWQNSDPPRYNRRRADGSGPA